MSEAQTQKNFDFELVSPERKLMSEKAWQVTVPGEEGDFGVRAGHSSLVSTIRPGVVEIIATQGEKPTKIFIAGGFADVTATNCTILAEEAMKVEELNQDEVEKEISDLQSKISGTKDEIEMNRFSAQLKVAQSKFAAVTGTLIS